jgi:AcrR family transcriptional regulator
VLSIKEGPNSCTDPGTTPAGSTRDLLLAAALAEFSRKGFFGTTTKDVATAAGVAEVTLFRHFTSKERLFEETMATYSFVADLEPLLQKVGTLPYPEAVSQLANCLFDALLRYKDWVIVMHGEVRRSPDTLMKLYQRFLDTLFTQVAGFFSQRQQRGELRSFDPVFAARALHGMVFCFFNVEELLLRKEYRPTDRQEAIAAFVNFLCYGTMA